MIDDVRGISFPFAIDPETGGVRTAVGPDKLRQNVRLVLGTRLGERPMQRDFGTRLASLVHDPNDAVLADLVQNEARQALLRWEPRVLVTAMTMAQEEAEAELRLQYVHTSEPIGGEMTVSLSQAPQRPEDPFR